ncbi:HXXEE domain-containing protein [Leifsonia sp. McL0607]|uniref:HXXEE domain-containing protein n=1 Tax=Leifsonia sp. McL0607 TaxID=3415672 RepID=UPI003CEB7CCE
MSTFGDFYRKQWPRVGAVTAMALGGASVLVASAKKPELNVRALSVMNSVAMSAHQYEEYVDPGYFPGMANRTMFKSDQPRNWPMNTQGLMCANVGFSALYVLPILFPKVKWLALPAAALGIFQAFGHGVLMPRMAHTTYSPGFLTSFLLHVPVGIATIRAIHAKGPITGGDVAKSAGALATFLVAGVVAPNYLAADRNSPYVIPDEQMGKYDVEPAAEESGAEAAK